MKSTFLSAIALTALLTVAPLAPAQDAKPVVVVSFAGYQRLMDDVSYLGGLTNKPGAAQQLEGMLQFFTQGQGLAGLDKARPWGAVASVAMGPGGPQPIVMGFLPVSDLDKLMQSLAAVQPQKMEDGTWKVQNEQATMFVRKQGNWAFVGPSAELLAKAPTDPTQLIKDLTTNYDIAVKVFPKNVPAELRQMLRGQLEQAQSVGLERQEDEDEATYEARKKLAQLQVEQLFKQIDDVEQITVGVGIDSEGHKLIVDVDVAAVPGSPTATKLAAQQGLKSSFGGFIVPESPVTAAARQHLGKEEIDQAVMTIDAARPTLLKEIDRHEDLGDKDKELWKTIATQLIDVAVATIKSGDMDTAFSVVGEGPLHLILATSVGATDELEKAAKSLAAEAASRHSSVSKLKVDADQHQGVRFHTMEISLPDAAGDIAGKLIGNPIPVVLGFGEKSAYVGVGADALKKLKEALDRSGSPSGASGPLGLTVTVAPILKAVAKAQPDKPIAAMLAGQLQGGNDHVRVTVSQEGASQKVRVEVEEGLIKLIGAAAGPGQGGGGQTN